MKAQQKNRALALEVEKKTGVVITVDDSARLRRAELALARWSEDYCNGDVGVNDAGRAVRYHDLPGFSGCYPIRHIGRETIARIKKICQSYGIYYYHQSDPRGAQLYVSKNPIDCQNYNQTGICVREFV